jgi:hypothetical protein
MKKQLYRHGEIIFVKIDSLPDNLVENKTNEIIRGSGNNPHLFKNGKLYLKNVNNYIFGYLEAKNTILKHLEHGDRKKAGLMIAKIPDGYYELRKENEFINNEFKQIID